MINHGLSWNCQRVGHKTGPYKQDSLYILSKNLFGAPYEAHFKSIFVSIELSPWTSGQNYLTITHKNILQYSCDTAVITEHLALLPAGARTSSMENIRE